VVMNDKGYGVIRQIQDAQYGGRHVYGDLQVPDLEGVAKLAGIPFWRVSKAATLEQTLKAALDAAGPSLVEVDVASIGAIPPYFPYDQKPKAA
ncbi:MAG: thiamine pyrophosphate-dependent enzyme, partial [Pseudorhodoplanes sp.]